MCILGSQSCLATLTGLFAAIAAIISAAVSLLMFLQAQRIQKRLDENQKRIDANQYILNANGEPIPLCDEEGWSKFWDTYKKEKDHYSAAQAAHGKKGS